MRWGFTDGKRNITDKDIKPDHGGRNSETKA